MLNTIDEFDSGHTKCTHDLLDFSIAFLLLFGNGELLSPFLLFEFTEKEFDVHLGELRVVKMGAKVAGGDVLEFLADAVKLVEEIGQFATYSARKPNEFPGTRKSAAGNVGRIAGHRPAGSFHPLVVMRIVDGTRCDDLSTRPGKRGLTGDAEHLVAISKGSCIREKESFIRIDTPPKVLSFSNLLDINARSKHILVWSRIYAFLTSNASWNFRNPT